MQHLKDEMQSCFYYDGWTIAQVAYVYECSALFVTNTLKEFWK